MESLIKNKRLMLTISVLLVIGLLVWLLFVTSLRVGKTEVLFTTVPKDSLVKIDGDTSRSGTRYLLPGTYDVTFTRDGFETTKKSIIVDAEPLEVGVSLPGDSDIARQYFKDNPDEEIMIEGVGGIESYRLGQKIIDANPIISSLPVRKVDQYFAIDYGIRDGSQTDTFLLIRNSSTDGRANAIQWIKQKGANPTDIDIRYDDYVSPLTDRTKSERGY